MADYYTVLTYKGAEKVATFLAGGPRINLVAIAVGDGNGEDFYGNYTRQQLRGRTSLINQRWTDELYLVEKDSDNPAWVITEGRVPVDTGGWYIREVGIFDADGDLIAIGVYPETYKPVLSNNIGTDLTIRSIIEVRDAESVIITIDPSVVQATREWVHQHKIDKDQIGASVNQLPTNAISDQRYMNEGIPIKVSAQGCRAVSFKKITSAADVNVLLLNHVENGGRRVLQGRFYFGAAANSSELNRSSTLLDIISSSTYAGHVAISGLLTEHNGQDPGGLGGSNAQICSVRYQGATWTALYLQNRHEDPRRDIFREIAFSGIFPNGALEWISDSDLDIAAGDAEPIITPILTRENNWQPTNSSGAFIGRPGDQIGNNTAWHSGNTLIDSNGFIKQA